MKSVSSSSHKTGSKATLKKVYTITIKNNSNTFTAYAHHLLLLASSLPYDLYNIKYEIDSSSRAKLHIHACFDAPSNLTFKDMQRSGWNIFIKPSTSVRGWNKYTNKDGLSEAQVLWKHAMIHYDMDVPEPHIFNNQHIDISMLISPIA